MSNFYNLKLRDRPFQAIVQGKKTIEIRANKQNGKINYKTLSEGDILLFENETTSQKISCIVKRKTHYRTVYDLLKYEGTTRTLSSTNSIKEGIKSIEGIADYKEIIEEFGVFAIEIELKTATNNVYKALGVW